MQRLAGWLNLEPKEDVMVWKQDLAKLKAAIRDTGAPPPPLPKPKPKPVEVKELHEEDAFFLAAMGAPAPRVPALPAPRPVSEAPVPEMPAAPALEVSFEAEIGGLKGLKPLGGNPVLAPKSEAQAPTVVTVAAPTVVPPTAPMSVEEPTPSDEPLPGPQRIQLAAGMAVEVDASLDLRHHSASDAVGRLRDRVEDGALLGWRTLHVTLGEDDALRVAFLAFIEGGGAPKVGRYAQAPIPMGGAQAWILYY